MELQIKDRIFIPQLLPQQSTFIEYNLKREIIKKIVITESDKKKYAIVENPEEGKITWDIKKDIKEPLAVDFSDQELKFLKKACESLVETVYPDDFWITVEKIYNAENV
jgi:predicted DNA binding protein